MDLDEQKSLSQLFYEAFKIHSEVENSVEPTNSDTTQNSMKRALKLLVIVISRCEELRLFSTNEEACEISTANLKYLLSPAICGALTMLVQTPREQRKSLLISAKDFLFQFLGRCKDYDIGRSGDIERTLKSGTEIVSKQSGRDLVAMNSDREAKIAKYKREKELEARLKHLKSQMGESDEDVENADEEIIRKYWMSMIEKWIDVAIESVGNIAQEKEILEFWEKLPDKDNPPRPSASNSSQNTGVHPRNFLLTRDKVQATVFGAGYPSLPTMTVEEFFESHAAAGTLPDQGPQQQSVDATQHEDRKSDDEDEIKKQRDFDDWKDTHRRGDGNRKNMG